MNSTLKSLNKRLRIYISGGISGKPNGNKEAFATMETKLYYLGYDVINPRRSAWPGYLSLDKTEEFKEGWGLMMREALRHQSLCDAVVFLPDWEQSKGACIEYQMARVFGQPCFAANLEEIAEASPWAPARVLVTP